MLRSAGDGEKQLIAIVGATHAGMNEASSSGWHVISMKGDWRTIFAEAPEQR